VDQDRTRVQLAAQYKRVEALRIYADLARLRFDNGYSSYIEVLDAERSLFDVELSYVQNQAVLFQALINLYKAMGGGWTSEAELLAAQAATPATETPRPCADEFERFCKDVPPGLGKMIICLAEHRTELSPACRDKVDKAVTKLEKAKQDCASDIATFCPAVTPGRGRLIDCLKKQPDKLTPACRAHVLRLDALPAGQPTAVRQGGAP
jgi:hypothetical protein